MIHLIGNAHLDPAWMWPLEEGLEAFSATCRSALERTKEFPGLIFTCSSAAHYEYVEQTDPRLFAEIKSAVAVGSWCIVGGWWVEADCNIPSGEALIRQAVLGQRYFQSRFGRIASVGYNIDSFGHNANMPALLRGAGLSSYVFMRPEEHECNLQDVLFTWRAPSGDSVTAYRLPLHYSNHQHDVDTKLTLLPDYPLYREGRDWMIFFGVGNHGGGPTIEQLTQIDRARSKRSDLVLSDPEKFFASVRPDSVLTREMNPHAIGAYSANAQMKQLNRRAENALLRAEAMQVMRGHQVSGFQDDDLETAWKDLCLTQFHDLLGGVSTADATAEAIALLQEAISIAERSARLDRQRIASCIDTSAAVQNLVVFNERAYERSEYVEFELWHPHASEKGDILRALTLESNDVRVPCQKIEPHGKIGEDRVRWLARVTAPSFGWATYRIIEKEANESAPSSFPEWTDLQLLVARDAGDTWAHGVTSYHPHVAQFSFVRDESFEAGPLRTARRTYLSYRHSRAEIEQYRYLDREVEEVRIMLDWHEPDMNVLLAVNNGVASPGRIDVRYEIPHSHIIRPADGNEYPGQTWLDAFDRTSGAGLAVINDSKYSFSVDGSHIYVTLARSKPFAFHVPPHELREGERMRYLDHGVQECRFLLMKHSRAINASTLARLSDSLNRPLHAHSESGHNGNLPDRDSLLQCDNPNVQIAAIKPADSGSGLVLRALETSGAEQRAELSGKAIGESVKLTLAPLSIKTVLVQNDPSRSVTTVDFLERPV